MNAIDKAIAVIHQRGWHQGGLRGDDDSLCILGACDAVEMSPPARLTIYDQLLVDGYHSGSVVRFNDAPTTSLEDVLLLLKRASARLDEAGS